MELLSRSLTFVVAFQGLHGKYGVGFSTSGAVDVRLSNWNGTFIVIPIACRLIRQKKSHIGRRRDDTRILRIANIPFIQPNTRIPGDREVFSGSFADTYRKVEVGDNGMEGNCNRTVSTLKLFIKLFGFGVIVQPTSDTTHGFIEW
jgi:hypothetical protein